LSLPFSSVAIGRQSIRPIDRRIPKQSLSSGQTAAADHQSTESSKPVHGSARLRFERTVESKSIATTSDSTTTTTNDK